MDSDLVIPPLPAPSSDEEFMQRLLKVAEEGRAHSGKALHTLTEIKAEVDDLGAKVSAAIADKIESDKSVRTISQMIRNRLGIAADQKPAEPAGGSGVKLVTVLAVAGVVTMCAGFNHPVSVSEGRPVNSAADEMTKARLALACHEWSSAFGHYQNVYNSAARENYEECLGKMAECKLRVKDYPAASWYANKLKDETSGRSSLALRLLGCVAEEQGDYATAELYYKAAEAAGDEVAGCLHRRAR